MRAIRRCWLVCLCVLLLTFSPAASPGWAQQTSPPQAADNEDTPATAAPPPAPDEASELQEVGLDTTTVLGTRRPDVPLSNVPASITIVDQPEIHKELATTRRIEDILKRQVPGFNPTNNGVRQIRGRTAQVFINGVPLNEQSRASSGNDLNLILPEQLAQIEVARGANSAFGFGSPGGIIALSTPQAESEELTFRTRISESFNPHHVGNSHQTILYQSASQIVGDFDFHVGAAVGYDGSEYDPEGDLALGFDNSALLGNGEEIIGSFDTSLGYDMGEAGRVRLAATFNHVNFEESYELVGDGVYRETFGSFMPQPRGDDAFRTSYTLNLSYERDDVFGQQLKVEGFTSDTRAVFYAVGDSRPDAVARDDQENTYYGFRSSLTAKLDPLTERLWDDRFDGATLTYGFDFIRNDFTRSRRFTDTGEVDFWIAPPVTLDTFALYSQLDVPITKRLDLTGGVRQEWYTGSAEDAEPVSAGGIEGGDIKSFELTLFNLGAVYHLDDHLDLFTTFSQGAEITQLGRAAVEAATAEQIDPEAAKSDQYELGLRGEWEKMAFSVAGFYTHSDLISSLQINPDDPDGLLIPLREPREFWGIELTTDWEVTEQVTVGTVLAWMDGVREPEGEDEQHISASEVPPLLITPYVEYSPLPWWRNRLQLEYRAPRGEVGGGEDFGEGRIDDLFLLNFSMAFDVGPGELQVGVENLLNEEYTSIVAEANNIGFTWLPEEGTRLTFAYTVEW